MYWPWLCVFSLIYYCCCSVLAQDTTTIASHSPSLSSPSAVTIYSTTSPNSAGVHSQGGRSTSSGSFSSNAASRRPLSSTRSAAHTAPITVSRAPAPATPYHPAPPPPSSTHRPPRPVRDHPPSTGAIIGAVLGGLAGVAVLLSLARCIYTYQQQPKRDRIAEVVERHRIQREMEELAHEEFSRTEGRPPSPPPLPLYQDSRLPAYEPATRPADTDV